MARKTIDKAAVMRVVDKLSTLAHENRTKANEDKANKDYFTGRYDAYTSASYRLLRLLDSDGRDS